MRVGMYLDPVADNSGGGAAQAASSTNEAAPGGAPQAFSPPAGQRLVPDSEYSSMEAWAKTAQSLGFKEPKEIEGYKGFFDAHRTAKTDLSLLTNLLKPQASQAAKPKDGPVDRDSLKAELMEELRREQSLREHDEYVNRLPTMYEQMLKEAVFKEADEDLDPLLKEIADARFLKARMEAQYPENHPLHGQRIGRVEEAKIKELVSGLSETQKKLAAWRLKAIGQAANRKAPATNVAGNSGNQGKPNKDEGQIEEDRQSRLERVRLERERLSAAGSSLG